MSSKQRDNLERLYVGNLKTKNNLIEIEDEIDNYQLDSLKLIKNQSDSQYNQLIKDVPQKMQKRQVKAGNFEFEDDNNDIKTEKLLSSAVYKGEKTKRKQLNNFDLQPAQNRKKRNNKRPSDSDRHQQISQSDEGDLEKEEQKKFKKLYQQVVNKKSQPAIEEDEENEEQDDEENEEQDDEQQDNFQESQENSQSQNEEEEVDNNKKTEKSEKKKYMIQEKEVKTMIEQMEQEDELILQKSKQQTIQDKEKAKCLRNQINIWKELGVFRLQFQKSLEACKKLPCREPFDNFIKNQKYHDYQKYLSLQIQKNIDLLNNSKCLYLTKKQQKQENKNYEKLLAQEISLNNITKSNFINNFQINTQQIIEDQLKNYPKSYIDEIIINWSLKTNLNNTTSQQLKKAGFQKIMQTPIGQVDKAMKSYEQLLLKSRLKRSVFRILGTSTSNLSEDVDNNIFDDTDIYTELLKEQILDQNLQERDEDGLLMNNTRLYLLEKKLSKQEKLKRNDIDRKASKGRKIRYTTHEKLVNFVNPIENSLLLESRNDIILSITSQQKPKIIDNTSDKLSTVINKTNKQQSIQSNSKQQKVQEDEDDIILI